MNGRTILLLGVMVIACVAALGDQFGMLSFLDQGGSFHESAMEKVSMQIQRAEEIINDGILADDALNLLEQRSLPYDPELARSAYQAWLTKLIEANKLAQSSVDVGMPTIVTITDQGKKKEAYKRYGFTLNGSGRLEQVTSFLYDFYQAGHLQKLNTVSMAPASNGIFTITLTGEAIGLPGCERKEALSEAIGNRLQHTDLDAYQHIVRRNIFSREAGETLKLITLSSVTFDKDGQPEAWFKVGRQQATKRLQRGGKFDVSVHKIEVIDIQPRSVLISVDGDILDLQQGKSIHDAITKSG